MIHFSENNTEWFPIVRHVDHVSEKQGLQGKQCQVMKQPLTAFKYLLNHFEFHYEDNINRVNVEIMLPVVFLILA